MDAAEAPAPVPSGADQFVAREALIYLPGISLGVEQHKTITGVVTRIQRALNIEAGTREATFRTEWTEIAVRPADAPPSNPVATIYRKDGNDEQPVLDIFQYDWAKDLIAHWEDQSASRRSARAVMGVIASGAVLRTFAAARNTTKGIAQLAIAFSMLLVMVLYSATVLLAAGQAVQQIVLIEKGTSASSQPAVLLAAAPGETGGAPGKKPTAKVTLVQWIAIFGSVVAGAAKKRSDQAKQAGRALLAANSYVRVAGEQPAVVGGLADLCETLAEGGHYPKVRIVAYSFGSIVAIDALFPRVDQPPEAFDQVVSLATIGSPFDFVRAMRKSWGTGRHLKPGLPAEWLNVYNPIDLLGSNFREDPSAGPATKGITANGADAPFSPTANEPWDLGIEMTFGNLIELYGFTSHGMYWGDDDTTGSNVFDLVVRDLYAGTPLLA